MSVEQSLVQILVVVAIIQTRYNTRCANGEFVKLWRL